MKKIILTVAIALITLTASSQISVNGTDITNEPLVEVWAFKKPFSTKESIFVNYGQSKFRPHYYDKNQGIDGIEKGEWMKVLKLFINNGFERMDERQDFVGNQEGRVITFIKK